jgi:hypothetical protein
MPLPIISPSPRTTASQHWYDLQQSQASVSLSRLEVQQTAFALLHTRLRAANKRNRQFKSQYANLQHLLWEAIELLRFHFADEIDQVILTSHELLAGIDLRELGYSDVVLTIVLRGNKRPYKLYRAIADQVFSQLDRSQFLPQFRLIGAAGWQAAVRRATAEGRVSQLGLTLLRRV